LSLKAQLQLASTLSGCRLALLFVHDGCGLASLAQRLHEVAGLGWCTKRGGQAEIHLGLAGAGFLGLFDGVLQELVEGI